MGWLRPSLLPFALGYAFSYLLRSALAALAGPLAVELDLTPVLVGAPFYLAFALALIALGLGGPLEVYGVLGLRGGSNGLVLDCRPFPRGLGAGHGPG